MGWVYAIIALVFLYVATCYMILMYKVLGKIERIEDMLLAGLEREAGPLEEPPSRVDGVVVGFRAPPPPAPRGAA